MECSAGAFLPFTSDFILEARLFWVQGAWPYGLGALHFVFFFLRPLIRRAYGAGKKRVKTILNSLMRNGLPSVILRAMRELAVSCGWVAEMGGSSKIAKNSATEIWNGFSYTRGERKGELRRAIRRIVEWL